MGVTLGCCRFRAVSRVRMTHTALIDSMCLVVHSSIRIDSCMRLESARASWTLYKLLGIRSTGLGL